MLSHTISAARLGVLTAALCAVFLTIGCGTSGSGSTTAGSASPADDASSVAVTASPTATKASATPDRAEIERRLALPRFTFVGEADAQGTAKSVGALAFIDSETDTLAFRPSIGSDLGRVAVAPDGRLDLRHGPG